MIKLWRDFHTRKTRTILVVLSIAVGVLGITAVSGTLYTLQPRMLAAYLSADPADVTVTTKGVSAETIANLKDLPNVAKVEGVFVFHTRWQVNGEWETLKIIAVPSLSEKQINRVTVEDGELPTATSILLERTVQDIAAVAPGETIVVQTINGQQQISVSGIAYDPTTPSTKIYNVTTAFMAFDAAESILGAYDFNEVQIRVSDENRITATVDDVVATLQADGLPVLSHKKRVPGNYPGRTGFNAILRLMGLLSLFAMGLCTFIVINTIVTILASEVPQIGTMKAVGATHWMVMRTYLSIIFSYGVLGSLFGIGFGVLAINWLIRYMAHIANVKVVGIVVPPLPVMLVGGVIGVIVPLAASLLPVYRATNATVHEAMVSYGIRVRAGLLDRLLTRITNLPINLTLALRNALYSKGRALLTILALTIAGICFVAVHAASASLNRTIDVISDTMDADVFTLFSVPLERGSVLPVMGDGAEAIYVETWLRLFFKIGDEAALVHGIPKNSTMYAHQSVLVAGRWFREEDTAVAVITEKFAQENYYAVGDLITLGTGEASQRWQIVGIVRDYTNQGRLFLVPYTELANLLETPGQTNMVLVRLLDRSSPAVNEYLATLTARMLRTGFEADIASIDELRADGASQFQIIVSFLLSMVLLVGIIGTLGLISTLTINVTERIQEIGVMRSVGADTTTVTRVFWLEGLCMGVISWLLASVLGYPVARAFVNMLSTTLLPVEFSLPFKTLLLLGVGILFVVSVAGFLPARSTSNISTSDILRYG